MKHIISYPIATLVFIAPAYIDNKLVPWIITLIENIL
jgi:hypothetical protein